MRGIGQLRPATARAALARLLALGALALALLAPASAAAAGGGVEGGETEVPPKRPGPKPQLILIHGGSFLYQDPEFRTLTRPWALEEGFQPHYVDYPLGNLPAAVAAVRQEARMLRQKVGLDRVYAYGASAGGTLAAILAGEGDVSAAVAKAPVSDLATWEWPLGRYGANYFETIVAGPATRLRLSPFNRAEERPLLVIQGRQDQVVPVAMNEAFAAKFPRVHLWLVPGGHTTERNRPWILAGAMRWLAQLAARHEKREEEAESPPVKSTR
ncbi:MAG: prolyl oligopeptidase family serine peptidase [Actinobacteria bacterium]|nr:prolyl oligopeptidase family serine peptidase [Actinomycetota bacterium]